MRQPLARAWLAVPERGVAVSDELRALFADEVNVRAVEVIADGSDLVERRVKPLLPKIGKRLGSAIPAVMAAARDGAVEFHADGSVTLGGVTLAADEVEIQATPRPGTAVADRDGLVVVLDTELTPGPASRKAMPASSPEPSRTCAGRPPWSSTTGSSCGWSACPSASGRTSPRSSSTPWPSCATASRRPRRRRPRSSSTTAPCASPCGAVGVSGPVAGGRPRWPIFLGLAAVVVVIDQLTKAWLVGQLQPGGSMPVIGDLVRLTFVQNTARCSGCSRTRRCSSGSCRWAWSGAIVWYHGNAGRSTILSVALGLLLGGAIGNLIDRFTRGYVVDFVDAGIGTLRFYTFNAADAAISTALLLLIVSAFLPTLRPTAGAGVVSDG